MSGTAIVDRTKRVDAPSSLILSDISSAKVFTNPIRAGIIKSLYIAIHSEGILTLIINILNTETVTIDGKVYTFQDTLTNVDGNINIGVDAEATLNNLVSAITLTGVVGTDYAAAMTIHPTVTAEKRTTLTMAAIAKIYGTEQESIAIVDGIVDAGGVWDDTTFGGVNAANVVDVELSPDGNNWFHDQQITLNSGAITTAESVIKIDQSMEQMRLLGSTSARITSILHITV